jgi:hypothetical protein
MLYCKCIQCWRKRQGSSFSQGLSASFAHSHTKRWHADALTGSHAKVSEYTTLTRELAAQVTEKDDRDLLLKDLDWI